MDKRSETPADRPCGRPSREERSNYWAAGGLAIQSAAHAWIFFGSLRLARLGGTWAYVIGVLMIAGPLAAAVHLLRRARRMTLTRRRLAGGQCLACGYDLRESPERCPECGRETREPTPRL